MNKWLAALISSLISAGFAWNAYALITDGDPKSPPPGGGAKGKDEEKKAEGAAA